MKEIGSCAFSDCHSLTLLDLPESVECLGAGLVRECKNISSLSIPKNVKEIEGHLGTNSIEVDSENSYFTVTDGFLMTADKTRLIQQVGTNRNIVIPDYIKVIGDNAFLYDDAVRTVVVPEGVETIGGSAFANEQIESITLPETVTQIADSAFGNKPQLTLMVKAGSYSEEYAIEHNLKYSYESNTDWLNS